MSGEVERTFEIINHTADVGIIAYGANIKQAFANAALALFSLITEPKDIEERLQRDLEITAEDEPALLVEWLNELIYLFDVEYILFNRFEIDSLTKTQLKARCYGEKIRPQWHKLKTGVKAATYHMLKIDKNGGGYKIRVIFDI